MVEEDEEVEGVRRDSMLVVVSKNSSGVKNGTPTLMAKPLSHPGGCGEGRKSEREREREREERDYEGRGSKKAFDRQTRDMKHRQ